MASLFRHWRWLACLALAVGCSLNPQPDLPGDTANGGSDGTAGGPPILNTGGSSGNANAAGAQGPGGGAGGSGQGGPEGGEGGAFLEGGGPPSGEAGQAGAAEAGALGVISH